MPYQSDYILRLVEEIGALVRHTLERARVKGREERLELAGQAIGSALDMDPTIASRLSPESLAALLELGRVDRRVVEAVVQAIEVEADLLGNEGDAAGEALRREQATAARRLLVGDTPAG